MHQIKACFGRFKATFKHDLANLASIDSSMNQLI